ncbi:hypothetical protein HELRODRAFT_162511 [Helobdella robusta]|uniref:Uncharacterized protein n=1 Tax=Helobdella robusta TaxID=6412 RepID=T1ESS1_HELRO|nr:hypothetical protein HELRODRAFT_162511 [Helobdella robusta]ESN99033.1 hypothetical protein HELRODRAFT_162511 [Helobdella robusta]
MQHEMNCTIKTSSAEYHHLTATTYAEMKILIVTICFIAVVSADEKKGLLTKCEGDEKETMRMTWTPYVLRRNGVYDFVSTFFGDVQSVSRLKNCITVWLRKRKLFDDCQVHERCDMALNLVIKRFFPSLQCPLQWSWCSF